MWDLRFFVGEPLTRQTRPIERMCDDQVIQVWCILFPAEVLQFERGSTTREQYHVPYFVLLKMVCS